MLKEKYILNNEKLKSPEDICIMRGQKECEKLFK